MSAAYQFNNLPWLEQAWQNLLPKLHPPSVQAFLLFGPKGIGKAQLCAQVCQFLLCESPANNTPCNSCIACTMWQQTAHPDFMMLALNPNQISVDNVRQVVDFMRQISSRNHRKVVHIAHAECMNTQASNALLKVLEEPQANNFFVLSSNQPQQLLPTILSRTLKVALPRLDTSAATSWLHNHHNLSTHKASQLCDYTVNCPLAADVMVNTNQADVLDDIIKLVGTMLAKKAPPLLSKHLTMWLKSQPLLIADILIWLLQNIVELRYSCRLKNFMQADTLRQRQWQFLVKSTKSVLVFKLLDRLYQLRKQQLSGLNPNMELAINSTLADWCAASR